jgi:hypothetical protein
VARDPTLIAHLIGKLGAPAADVRRETIRVLTGLGPSAVPELAKALQGEDRLTRQGVMECLSLQQMLAKAALPQIYAARDDKDEQVQKLAGQALVALGQDALRLLGSELAHKDPARRLKAVSGYALFTPHPSAVGALRGALKHKDPAVRKAAEEALKNSLPKEIEINGRLTAKDVLDDVRKDSHHKVHEVRLTAGRVYQIDLRSSEFDPYLRLEDSGRKRLAEDDDSGGQLNARLEFQAPATGPYRIVVTSYKRHTGSYTLTVKVLR